MEKVFKEILKKLTDNNHVAYIVGGYTRDNLLGISSFDVDICTSAKLDDLKLLFPDFKIFEKYWSIKSNKDKYTITINTFRKESEYKNNNPVKIEYVSSLKEDLKRRDFTINSICYDSDFNLIDLYNGVKDLEEKVIRTIGKANIRFEEDKTRVLRAIRLMCLLNFNLNEEIINYIKLNRDFLKYININKYKEELDKIINNNKFDVLLNFINKYDLNDIFNFNNCLISDSKEGIYSQIMLPSNFPFTRYEKKIINIYKDIINRNEINDIQIKKLSLKELLVIGKIINVDIKNLKDRYKKIK